MTRVLLPIVILMLIALSIPLLYLASGRPLEFWLGSYRINHQIVLGEGTLGNLDVGIDLRGKIQQLDDRLILTGTVSNDELFKKIQSGFYSQGESDGTTIAHYGDVKLKWQTLNSLDISYIQKTNVLRLRANAKLRLKFHGKKKSGNRNVNAETIASITPDGVLRLEPKSLNIENVPHELDKYILGKTALILIPLSTCLKDRYPTLLDINYPEKSNTATIKVSLSLLNTVRTGICFASR